jgi:hypothetical protein
VEIRETIPPIQLSICGEVSFPSFGEKRNRKFGHSGQELIFFHHLKELLYETDRWPKLF